VKVAVPIISTDEGELLRHALPTVLLQQNPDVLVIDNASNDSTAQVAAEFGVRCLRLEQRHPYSRAMNVGLRAVDGEAVLMMQPDCFLTERFLAAATERLEDQSVGSVAPKLIKAQGPDPDQRLDLLDAAGMVVDRRRKNLLVGHGRAASAFARSGEVFGADGASALYRRSALEDAMLGDQVFDEDLVSERDGTFADWATDADLAWRLRALGWRCVYEPRAVAYHVRRYSPTTRSSIADWQRTVQFRNRYLMIVKNDPLTSLLRDLPFVLGYEVAALGYALLRERFLLSGYREAASLLGVMRTKRVLLQKRRRLRRTSPPPYGLLPPV
jgi:GT2 family glycosyltransferase